MDGNDSLPLLFIGIAVAIGVAAVLLTRLFRRTVDRSLPGSGKEGATGAGLWGPRDDGGGDGGD